MNAQSQKAQQFAALHVKGNQVILFNIRGAGSARGSDSTVLS